MAPAFLNRYSGFETVDRPSYRNQCALVAHSNRLKSQMVGSKFLPDSPPFSLSNNVFEPVWFDPCDTIELSGQPYAAQRHDWAVLSLKILKFWTRPTMFMRDEADTVSFLQQVGSGYSQYRLISVHQARILCEPCRPSVSSVQHGNSGAQAPALCLDMRCPAHTCLP